MRKSNDTRELTEAELAAVSGGFVYEQIEWMKSADTKAGYMVDVIWQG